MNGMKISVTSNGGMKNRVFKRNAWNFTKIIFVLQIPLTFSAVKNFYGKRYAAFLILKGNIMTLRI